MALFSNNRRLSLLVSATLSSWAIVTAPSLAANVPTITFNSDNYKTFTTTSTTGATTTTSTINNAANATTALLDNAPAATNVELWYTTEDPKANVGFTFKQGAYEATVTSVTKSDWSLFGQQWFDDFLTAYKPATMTLAQIKAQPSYNAALAYIQTNGVPRAGDPNIGSVKLNETTGDFSLDLIGHYDLRSHLLNPATRASYLTDNLSLNNLIMGAANLGKPLSMSEVAKVTSNGQTYFAYSFAAQQSGISSSDGTESFTGVYKWSQKLNKSVSAASTPEPSILLGMMALGGSAIASRRKRNRA